MLEVFNLVSVAVDFSSQSKLRCPGQHQQNAGSPGRTGDVRFSPAALWLKRIESCTGLHHANLQRCQCRQAGKCWESMPNAEGLPL